MKAYKLLTQRQGESVPKRLFTPTVCFFLVFALSASLFSAVRFSDGFNGYYLWGAVHIKAWRIDSYSEYKFISDHEFAHHLYNAYFTEEDKDNWEQIVMDCGFESSYSQSFRSRSLRLEEEFADSFAMANNGGWLCKEKIDFIMERWT